MLSAMFAIRSPLEETRNPLEGETVFSNEADTASREETRYAAIAFSSEVETGSREENASKQKFGASVLIRSEPGRF
jgi:hypothetical protein